MRAGLPTVVAAVASLAMLAGQEDSQALQRMVASERAFAAATLELGVRDGFLAFFAADAVQIQGGATGRDTRIVSAVAALRARPLAALPIGAALLWNPHTGQIADDGSIGWLTGPFVVLDQAQRTVVGQGAYFSVWKRQANGTWRVWLDEGITLPETWRDASEFVAAPAPTSGEGGETTETAEAAEVAVAAGGDAWRERWSRSVRIHREGRMPIVGQDEADSWSRQAWSDVSFTLARVEQAASDDLAIALGGYDAETPAGAEHGTWARVWRRDLRGRWRIVFETNKAAGDRSE